MRWKLLIAASLAAALVGVGAVAATARMVAGPTGALSGQSAVALASLLVPLASIIFASLFVYRHTARKRTVQATMTALLAGTLTLAALFAGSLISDERTIETAPTPPLPSRAS
jgi:uncharacterized membrane protein